jgi:folate-dependent phosphoribosylglycinamide formyltransferase PurN
VSGRGSNLVALHLDLARDGAAAVVLAISDRPAEALTRASALGIRTHQLVDHRDASEWLRVLDDAHIDLLVLAGYLRLVPAAVVADMQGRVINVHPALLPRHGGRGMHGQHVHRAVLDAGDDETGATVHLVDEAYDRGRILGQGRVAVAADATAESLAASVLAVEHRLLPAAVRAAARAGRPVPFDFA